MAATTTTKPQLQLQRQCYHYTLCSAHHPMFQAMRPALHFDGAVSSYCCCCLVMGMCVDMCVGIRTDRDIDTCADRVRVQIVYMHMHRECVWTCVRTGYRDMHGHMYVCVDVHLGVFMDMCARMHACTRACVHAHTQMHARTHAHGGSVVVGMSSSFDKTPRSPAPFPSLL